MRKIRFDPDVADCAPSDPATLPPYDHEHAITYLRLPDATAEAADWREVTQIVPHIDPEHEPVRAHSTAFSRRCPRDLRAETGDCDLPV